MIVIVAKGDNMPTGYTAELMEKGQTFPEFIMGCARAFGALILKRDDPSGTAIPEKFEPSNFHAKRLIEANEKLVWLKSMDDSEKEAFGRSERNADIKRNIAWLEKSRAEDARLDSMTALVKEWIPPTADHQGLKDFMLEQINISKNGLDYVKDSLAEAEKKLPMAYYVAAVSSSSRAIEHNTKVNADEIERANERSEWVRKLRESI